MWKWISVITSIVAGGMSARWVDVETWKSVSDGLIAFLGLLCAALIQVIPVTANFIQSDKLTPTEAQSLSLQLTKQQRFWLGLLALVLIDFIFVILASITKARIDYSIFSFTGFIYSGPILSFFVASITTLVVAKLFGIFEGIISLQNLRNDLVIESAKRAAVESSAQDLQNFKAPTVDIPTTYGEVIRH